MGDAPPPLPRDRLTNVLGAVDGVIGKVGLVCGEGLTGRTERGIQALKVRPTVFLWTRRNSQDLLSQPQLLAPPMNNAFTGKSCLTLAQSSTHRRRRNIQQPLPEKLPPPFSCLVSALGGEWGRLILDLVRKVDQRPGL